MDYDAPEKNSKMIGSLELSIISAQKKYFGDSAESPETAREESILYDTVIRYFTGKS